MQQSYTNYPQIDMTLLNKIIAEKEQLEIEDIMEEEHEYVKSDYNHFNQDNYYPPPDFDIWESFLGRQLEQKERKIIYDYLLEKDTNLQIKSLHNNIISNGYFFIPKLTKNNGNCLWECLSILGYGKASEIRKNIAALLLLVKNDWNFFPNINTCPEELFINCNDVEVVKDKNTGIVYEYDYDMMVVDLYSNHSWTRLPMELILMTICRVYEINFKIFSNKSDYINTVSVVADEDENVYLGHINEEHYIPIVKIDDDFAHDPVILFEYLNMYPIYTSAKNKYDKLAKILVDNFELYNGTNDLDKLGISIETDKINENTNSVENRAIVSNLATNDIKEVENFNDFHIVE